MKFGEFQYTRPDMEDLEKKFKMLIERFEKAQSALEQKSIINDISKLRNTFITAYSIAEIRHTINTEDPYYDEENSFFDEVDPLFDKLIDSYYRALHASRFKEELEESFGSHLFHLVEAKLKTFDPSIIDDLKRDNALSSKYIKLRASAKILFHGQERNLSQMELFFESKDRGERKEAQEAVSGFYRDHEEEFDQIFDEMVKIRHRMAQKLGFDNFIPLAYLRLDRTDYDATAVAQFRDQVLHNIVPVVKELGYRQAKRLSLDALKYYDEPMAFTTGNATPKGDSKWILERGKEMYEALSKETGEFINFMIKKDLFDLEAKKGKAGGGYCSYINDYRAPFIFSNFNGTSGDVDVLTHEAGHAFQVYQSRDYQLPEYVWPTLEACEIHSMSMEFLTWPWMETFFKEDVEKYKFNHLSSGLQFIPYGVAVDEFQHFVYQEPHCGPEARKRKWSEIEKKYLPNKDYADNDFLKRGGLWFKQLHIFTDPFYYIDYTLAQICALQFFVQAMENREEAWANYLKLCKKGGSMPFTKLLDIANLDNPFDDGTVKKVLPAITQWLANVDDQAL